MPKGFNNMNARKLRRQMERQHEKGKVSEEEMQEFKKQTDTRNKILEAKKKYIDTMKTVEQTKNTNTSSNQNTKQKSEIVTKTDTLPQITTKDKKDTVSELNIPINEVQTTKITIAICLFQIIMSSLMFCFSPSSILGYMIGFFVTVCEVIKCLIMKRFPYRSSNKTENNFLDGMTDNVTANITCNESINKTDIGQTPLKKYSFKNIGKKVIILDMLTTVLFVLTGTSYLMLQDVGLIRTFIFFVLSVYKLYATNSSCFNDNVYVKDLSPAVLSILFYLVVYIDIYRMLFFIAVTLFYHDIKGRLILDIKSIFNDMKILRLSSKNR